MLILCKSRDHHKVTSFKRCEYNNRRCVWLSNSPQKGKVLLPGHCTYSIVLKHQLSLKASQCLQTPVAPRMPWMVTVISPGLLVPETSWTWDSDLHWQWGARWFFRPVLQPKGRVPRTWNYQMVQHCCVFVKKQHAVLKHNQLLLALCYNNENASLIFCLHRVLRIIFSHWEFPFVWA